MRKPCLDCVLKHLGAAAIIEEEINNGYPQYRYLLYGHMDQATAEAWGANKYLARLIRQHRITFQLGEHDIPFEDIAEYVTCIASMKDAGDAEGSQNVKPPKACLTGLSLTDGGDPLDYGDTRE